MAKTTKKHFDLFVKEAKKWIDFWGLTDWRIYFYHEDWSDAYGDAKAWYSWDIAGHVGSLCLNTSWKCDLCENEVRKTAFHEVCHILLGRLDVLATRRYLREGELEEEVHAIIRRIENCIFK